MSSRMSMLCSPADPLSLSLLSSQLATHELQSPPPPVHFHTTHTRDKENAYAHSDHAHCLVPRPTAASFPLAFPTATATATAPAPLAPAKYKHPHSPNPSSLASQRMDFAASSPYAAPPTLSSCSTHAYAHSQATSPPPQHGFVRPVPPFASTPPAPAQHQSYLRPVGGSAQAHAAAAAYHEPTMDQLLAQQGRGFAAYPRGDRDRDRDSTMASATGVASWRKGQGFKEWEKVRLNSAEVKRKADVAQLYFYDHYFDLLTYLHSRKGRLATFRESVAARQLPVEQAESEWSSYRGRERVLLRKRRTKLQLDQFHILTQVGQGGYGEVYLARHKETHQVVALKKMKKKTLLKMDEIRHVLTERDILASTNSPWLVRLLYAFQDPTHVYLAMDFIAGGDFRTLLNNSGVLKEEHARFYISEMFCAVTELHRLGYIHRDLKPENFLIDPTGHIKLTDFGLAAGALNPGKIENLKHKLDEVKDRELIYRSTIEMKSMYKSIRMAEPRYADSVVGSPDYMAIETLRGQSYTFSVDYWSLGCILFEFLSGFPPFSGATAEETWLNLKNWSKSLRRPHYDRPEDRIFNLSDVGWSAITSLIQSKDRRLSTLDDVKAHPFFATVDWAGLRDSRAPFIPALDSEVDSGYFDDFTSEADMKKYAEVREKQANVDRVREKDEKFGRGVFVGFTFRPHKKEPVEFLEGDDELVTLF